MHEFAAGELAVGVSYWVDADPGWPGVYYAKIDGGCPHGGSEGVNCQLVGFADDVLEANVAYTIVQAGEPPGVYYRPDFAD